MKRIFTIIISAALLSSCADMLNTAPADQIATVNMWTSESLAEQGIAGLYRNFYFDNLSTSSHELYQSYIDGYPKNLWMGLEFQSQAARCNGLYALTWATKTATDNCINYEWKWSYTGIHRINDAIENLYKAGLSTDKYEKYICEARFLRAWYYFHLNRIFQGVPLYLEVISESNCTRGQSTSTEVWEAVIDDLNYCIDNDYCPENTLTSDYGRPSKGAAYALRGQVYMWLAWENDEDTEYYQLAANDFEKVSECGYGLWAGNFIDFFNYENEKDHEMIFAIQFTEDVGYCDNLELLITGRDTYNGWSYIRPSTDFVNYFQNADGTKFNWTDVIPEWDDNVFVQDIAKREVFFLRDSISLDSDNNVVRDYWDESQAGQIQERIQKIGVDVFKKYYLKDGNEDRIRSAYNNRDPRLKDIVLTPYDPYDTYSETYNDDNMLAKEVRWPFLLEDHKSGKDYYVGNDGESIFIYKKYVYNLKGMLNNRLRGPSDWPLIRYTDIYLLLAECYVHLGRLSDAVSIVNEIRSRAKMPSVSVGSADEVMEDIRYERRVELCLEGQDWFDEWRWGTYKEMKFQGNDVYGLQTMWGEWENVLWTWYYTDYMYPFSAPASECERNPNLQRRDGWSY